jgi:hypothetical protein
MLGLSMQAGLEVAVNYFNSTVFPAIKDGFVKLADSLGERLGAAMDKLREPLEKFRKLVEFANPLGALAGRGIAGAVGSTLADAVEAARDTSGDPTTPATAAREALAAFIAEMRAGIERIDAPDPQPVMPPELSQMSEAITNFRDLVTTSFRRIGGEMGGRDLSGMNIEKEQLQVQRRAMESAKTTASHLTSLVAAAIPFYRAGNVAKYA